MTETPSRWLKSESTESPTKLRLFCFPFAGAGTSAHMGWRKHLPPEVELISDLSDKMLIKALSQRYGANISNGHQELLELMLPTLRADFKLIETTFDYQKFNCPIPITAFNGSLDHSVSGKQMKQWYQYSNHEFKQIEINGPHFYLQSAKLELIQYINQQLVT